MSKPSEEIITCNSCGTQQRFMTWDSINVTLDRELKQKLISGELTLFGCAKCGWSSQVNYSLLYHDMEKSVMFWLWPQPGEPKTESIPFEKMMGNYRLRLVGSRNELIEKIFIFDSDIDDRVMELLKLVVCRQTAAGKHPLTGTIFFAGRGQTDEGHDSFQFEHLRENEVESFLIPAELYMRIGEMVAGKLPMAKTETGKWLRVDQNYAKSMV